MQKTVLSILALCALGVLTTSALSDTPVPHAVIVAPAIPSHMTLAGEEVPLNDFGVREALDRELIVNTYRHSGTILYMKRASRWFPVIEPILAEEGVPDDFKYLAVIESGLSQVVSPAGLAQVLRFVQPARLVLQGARRSVSALLWPFSLELPWFLQLGQLQVPLLLLRPRQQLGRRPS